MTSLPMFFSREDCYELRQDDQAMLLDASEWDRLSFDRPTSSTLLLRRVVVGSLSRKRLIDSRWRSQIHILVLVYQPRSASVLLTIGTVTRIAKMVHPGHWRDTGR
jgi:hypothetical protein